MKRARSLLEYLPPIMARADKPALVPIEAKWQRQNAALAKSPPELADLWARLTAIGGRTVVGEPEPWFDVLLARGVVMVRVGARIIKRTVPDRYVSAIETWSDFFPQVLLVIGYALDGRGLDAPPDTLRLQLLDYLSRSPLAWTFDGDLATVGIGENVTLAAQVLPGGAYTASRIEDWRAEPLGMAETWADVVTFAEDLFSREGTPLLALRRRRWRIDDATEKQERLLRRWDVWRDDLTRGAAAQVITHEAARRALRIRHKEGTA